MTNTRLRDFEKLFKALADKQRLRIIGLLADGPLVVNDIRSVLKLSMSTVSQHLAILREADLVIDSKKGRWVEYRLSDQTSQNNTLFKAILKELNVYFQGEEKMQDDLILLKQLAKPDVSRPTMAHRLTG